MGVIVRDLKINLCCFFRVQWPWHTILLHMTLPVWKHTVCSNWRTSCVICTTAGLALSEFLLLARWVLWETRVIDKNACIIRCRVKWNSKQTSDTSTQCILLDVKKQLVFWPWMVAVIRPYKKEIKGAIFATAVCSFRYETVFFCSTVYFFNTMYCTVWDLTLQIAAVMLPF